MKDSKGIGLRIEPQSTPTTKGTSNGVGTRSISVTDPIDFYYLLLSLPGKF